MSFKKTRISSQSLTTTINRDSKPSTATRAAITAEIKLTRGKQLVEHDPLFLIPDPNNPRPGDQIDDLWLKKHLLIDSENNLCHIDTNKEYNIPTFAELPGNPEKELEDDYDFLRNLAISIRNDGLIEPIEIFLADKNNEPEYFINSELDYGYVVLEGHQRRLAGIISGVNTVTCIEITDETMLARLKVKHRKLRRQLSENNLRKGLTVSQNFKIVRELFKYEDCINLSVKELSSIIGLNEDIAGALKRLSLSSNDYPKTMIDLIEDNLVSFKWIRTWLSKSYEQIEIEVNRIKNNQSPIQTQAEKKSKPRGKSGGAIKRHATFKVKKEMDSTLLQQFLLKHIPELKLEFMHESPFHSLEMVLNKLMDMAKNDLATRVGFDATD